MDLGKIKQSFNKQQITSVLNDGKLFSPQGNFSLGNAQAEYQKIKDMPTDQVDQNLKDALLKLTTDGNYEAFSGGTNQNITKDELNQGLAAVNGGGAVVAKQVALFVRLASTLQKDSSGGNKFSVNPPPKASPESSTSSTSSPQKEADLAKALENSDTSKVKQLIADGVDVNAVDKASGKSMLELAALSGNADDVKALIDNVPKDKRIDFVNKQNSGTGRTAMHDAAIKGDAGTWKELVNAGGDSSIKDQAGVTPLDTAQKVHPELLKDFTAASIPTLNSSPQKEADLAKALENSDTSKVKQLIADGVDVNAIDKGSEKSMLELAALSGSADDVNALINNVPTDKQKDFVNKQNAGTGQTALFGAAVNGQLDSYTALIKVGGDPSIKDQAGKTALDYAKQYHPEAATAFTNASDGYIDTNSNQTNMGDCVLLASAKSLSLTDAGRSLLHDTIKPNADGTYNVKFKGSDKSYTVTNADLTTADNKTFAGGDKDLQILGAAANKYFKDHGKASGIEDGLQSYQAMALLTGIPQDQSIGKHTSVGNHTSVNHSSGAAAIKKFLLDAAPHLGNDMAMTATGTVHQTNDDTSGSMTWENINHEVSITKIDAATGTVTYVNPWDSSKEHTVSIDEMANTLGGGSSIDAVTFGNFGSSSGGGNLSAPRKSGQG